MENSGKNLTKELFEEKPDLSPKQLPEKTNFIEWYNKILELAEITDRSYPVKGTFVWMPYGLKIMKNLIKEWDRLFQDNGIEEVYFPLFVPREYAQKNDEWFKGFEDEMYYASPTGESEKFILRSTGEPAMYPIFELWIKRGMLPIRVYQTVSSFRHEGKTTHTMIRDREITYWYEIHTVHRTKEEAKRETDTHIEINDFIWKEVLSIPPIKVQKPPYEIFPGAEYAIEYYTILPDGRLIENGSVNNLGQAYAKKFELEHVDKEGNKDYCWQVCTGNGPRYLVAVFSLHGDERGLVLPPKISPIDTVILPIYRKKNRAEVLEESRKIHDILLRNGIRSHLDYRDDIRTGEKFYLWEMKGVPLRIEVGGRELSSGNLTVFRRDLKSKSLVGRGDIVQSIRSLLDKEIPLYLYSSVGQFYKSKIKHFHKIDEAMDWIGNYGVSEINWCESRKCFEDLVSLGQAIEPIGSLEGKYESGKCVVCGEPTEKLTLIGRTY